MSLKVQFYCDEKYRNCVPEPTQAFKCYPRWFSELPLNLPKFKYEKHPDNPYELFRKEDHFNIKKCLGIQDILSTGYLIPAWADFIFRETEDGDLHINWMENHYDLTEYLPHSNAQYSTMPKKPIYGHLGKIFSPWIIKTDPGVSCLITNPSWHRNTSFTSVTAIWHTDKSPLRIPWFFEWNYKIQSGMDLESMSIEDQVVGKGEPIILIIPFYRKNYTSKINYISTEKWNNQCKTQINQTHDTMGGECPYKNFRKTLGKFFG